MAKNIVLLSDGTGNAAGKAVGTNVWRLYTSLDLQRPDQVAFYDDGVGSRGVAPLKALAGAFGFGLKENVREIYEFLCRSYMPGDRIFLFGFSRGAFTVRTVVGLVNSCGLITQFTDQVDLHRKSRAAYREFRKSFSRGVVRESRRVLGMPLAGAPQAKKGEPSTAFADHPVLGHTIRPEIEFVGVWDTVDAYGLPLDELAQAWDYFIYPFRFPDQKLCALVKRACHALALDDERHTFHPLLWDESDPADAARIEQVWFAGAHSNVGGGYPDDNLALVALDWMMSRAEYDAETRPWGLHFIEGDRQRVRVQANVHGKLYDSRRGLASYYRYMPRPVAALSRDEAKRVTVALPKIHESVFQRIRNKVVAYTPLGIPPDYAIVPRDSLTDAAAIEARYGDGRHAAQRVAALERAWDLVYWRRWLYRILLGVTLAAAISPLFLTWVKGGSCDWSAWGGLCATDAVLNVSSAFVPAIADNWFEALGQNPHWFLGFALAFVALYVAMKRTGRALQAVTNDAWAHLRDPAAAPPPARRTRTQWLRNLFGPRFTIAWNWWLASVGLLLIGYAGLAVANKTVFELREASGNLCRSNGPPGPLPAEGRTIQFSIDNPCFASGIVLESGRHYRVTVAPSGNADTARSGGGQPPYLWLDGKFVAGPDGYRSARDDLYMLPAAAARRDWSQPWFKLLGRINAAGTDGIAIGLGPTTFRAPTRGELFLFVNDAVCGLCFWRDGWSLAYRGGIGRNVGTAAVTIEEARNDR